MTDVRERLLTENPWKLMITLSLPAILGQFVVGLYAFVDSIYVGQMVGTSAMSAVSAASPFVLINNGIAVLIGIGSSSVLSRAIGKKDMDTVNRIMGNLTFLVLFTFIYQHGGGNYFCSYFAESFWCRGSCSGDGCGISAHRIFGFYFCQLHAKCQYGYTWRGSDGSCHGNHGRWRDIKYRFRSDPYSLL